MKSIITLFCAVFTLGISAQVDSVLVKFQPKKGDVQKLEMVNSTVTVMKSDLIDETTKDTKIYGLKYEVTKVDKKKGHFWVDIEYLYIRSEEGGVVVDTREPSTYSNNPLFGKMYNTFVGSGFTMVLDEKASLVTVEGMDEFYDNLINVIAEEMPEDQVPVFKEQMSSLLSKDDLASAFTKLYSGIDAEYAKVGTTYSSSDSLKFVVKMNFEMESIVNDISNGKIGVFIKSNITTPEGSTLSMGGMEMGVDMKGYSLGQHSIDIKTGLFTSMESYIYIEGTMETMGLVLPMKIVSKEELRPIE